MHGTEGDQGRNDPGIGPEKTHQGQAGEGQSGRDVQRIGRRMGFRDLFGYPGDDKSERGHKRPDDAEREFRQVDHSIVLAGQGYDHPDQTVQEHAEKDDRQGKGGFKDPGTGFEG